MRLLQPQVPAIAQTPDRLLRIRKCHPLGDPLRRFAIEILAMLPMVMHPLPFGCGHATPDLPPGVTDTALELKHRVFVKLRDQ